MFSSISLKNKLAISASLAIILGAVLVQVVSFNSAISRLDKEVAERLESSTSSYNQYVSDWIKSKEWALTSIDSEANTNTIVSNLKQLRDSASLDNVFLAFPDGSQVNANGVVLPPGNDDPRKWGWYINAMKNPSQVFMDNPTVAAATGANVVSLGSVLDLAGERLVLGADVEITNIIEGLNKVILPGEGYMFIANDMGNIFTHNNTELLNESVQVLGINFSDIQRALETQTDVKIEIDGQTQVLRAEKIANTSLITVAMVDYASLVAPLYQSILGQVVLIVVLVIVCVFLFNVLCNYLFRPLQNVSEALEEIAQGNGDLTHRLEVTGDDEVGRLSKNFNDFVGSMHELISHIREQSLQLTDQSKISDERANWNVSEINQQQQKISTMAATVLEMVSTTDEIANHAEKTANTVQESEKNTQNGLDVVMENKKSINRLSDELKSAADVVSKLSLHSQDISTVLATIQGIAEQTNLLALNAAIEAARAGEQGRGFAVVADEVRVLSKRTHDSTEEIKSTIDTLQLTATNAVKLMENSSEFAVNSVEDADKASAVLQDINEMTKNISLMASDIAAFAKNQVKQSGAVSSDIETIKDVAEQLVGSASENSKDASKVKALSSDLMSKVSTFKL